MSGANFSLLSGPCSFCGARNYTMSNAGPSVCGLCDTVLSVIGPRPIDVSSKEYAQAVLEIGGIVQRVPQAPGERWADYHTRVVLAVNVVRAGRPMPMELLKPLSDDALKATKDGKPVSQILLIAALKTKPRPVAPTLKKFDRGERPARDVKPAPAVKIW